MKISKKNLKFLIITFMIIVIVFLLGLLIYNNIFADSNSNRFENIENYQLTKSEKKAIKEKLNEIESVSKIDVYVNTKIIKIFLEIEEEEKFEDLKKICNEAIEKISSENLEYYDVEIFVDCLNEESEVYPKIGYKHKKNSEFTWNR